MGLPRNAGAFLRLCLLRPDGLSRRDLSGRHDLASGQPYTGQNFTLTSITPVVVGGTLLSGGRGGVIGTLMGVYLVSLLNNLLNFMDLSTHYQLIVQGLIVIIAVSVYVENKKRV